MSDLYLLCAIVGGVIFVCQLVLTFAGIGHHDGGFEGGHDITADHDHSGEAHSGETQGSFQVLSVRGVIAAITFFGLAGRAALAAELDGSLSLIIALAAGAIALVGMALLMRTMFKLQAEGTVDIQRAIGASGTVYLTIPANKAGSGKVTLSIQNRTMEYNAVTTRAEALPTGAKVVVVKVIGSDTVEVDWPSPLSPIADRGKA